MWFSSLFQLRQNVPAGKRVGGAAMSVCVICHFETLADDVVLRGRGQGCLCLACNERETETRCAMPKGLHREIAAILKAIPPAAIGQGR
jgi:hypothetical protein